jgi:hypothetical protein
MLQTMRHAPPAPPDPAELAGLCARLGNLCEAEGRRALGDDGWDELSDHVFEITRHVRQQSFASTRHAIQLAAARAEGFEDGRASVLAGRHRARRAQGQFWPRAVPSVVPAAVLAALRHGARTHVVLPAAATAAAVTLAAASYVTLPDVSHAAVRQQPYASASLAPASGILIPAPSYQPRHAARADAASARAIPAVSAAPVRVAPSSPHVPPPAAPVAGTLDVATVQVRPGPSGAGEIDFEAAGGPVTWFAWASPGTEVSASAGTLAAGQPVALTVTLAPGATAGTVWVSAGGKVTAIPVTG